MPHQCVHCGKVYPAGSKSIIEGCDVCHNRFFFYIRDEKFEELKNRILEIPKESKKQVEKDIREIAGITEDETPVILDIESIRVLGPGKFELDLVNLFNKKRPIVYKLEEGKYMIDLLATFGKSIKELKELQEKSEE